MSNLTRIALSSLPRDIEFSENGDTLLMKMDQACTTANMQENSAAFEAWALYGRTAGYKSVILSESIWTREISNAEKLHYHRFLYRVSCFIRGFEWFTVSDELRMKADEFENTELSRDDLYVNAPIIEAASETESPEAKMERLLVSDEYREFLNKTFGIEVEKYYNQLPVGLFGGRVVSKAAIFPRSHAAIDIWGLSGRTFHLIELKVKKNQNLGVLSEVFFYACYIYDMYCQKHLERKDPADLRKYKRQGAFLRGYPELINANIDSVVAHILTEQKHPRLDAALAELRQYKHDDIRFANAVGHPLSKLTEKPI